MSAEGVADFISTVELHFPRPKFNGDPAMNDGWMASVTRALKGYDDDILAQAALRIIDTRTKKEGAFFPLPAECKEVCSAIAAESMKAQQALLPAPNPNDWSPDRLALAFDLCKSDLGQRATREGWIGALYEYCRKHMEIPRTEQEISSCKRSEHDLREVVDLCLARAEEEPSLINKAVANMAKTFLSVREERALKGVSL